MDFREWWAVMGDVRMAQFATEAGISLQHLLHCKAGVRTPGADLCLNIIDYARKHTPQHVPDLETLLRGAPRKNLSHDARK